MRRRVRIGLIGDHNPQVRAHLAIPKALAFAGERAGCEAIPEWIATSSIDGPIEQILAGLEGVWCVPASPYCNMAGALEAIRHCRERGVPFLGTCGGFQHGLIEFARNRLGLVEADHAESNPAAVLALIAPLSCSLVGAKGKIRLTPGSQAARIYGRTETVEEYHCNYGLDQRYESLMEGSELRITGRDENWAARVVEHVSHPFYFGTLFQPELAAVSGCSHPLIEGFVRAAIG